MAIGRFDGIYRSALKYDGKDWKRISLEGFPAVLTKTNIIVGSPPTDLLKPFYTVAQVEEQNRDIQAEEYKTIIRKPFAISFTPPLNKNLSRRHLF